jgi:hypothetical protein
VLDGIGEREPATVAGARAAAREVAWAQRAETRGSAFPPARAGAREMSGLVIDLDASLVVCHWEKESAAPTFKGTFGYHPLMAFLDNTGEFLAARLRAGNAGANTAPDHIEVLDAALVQIPDEHRHGTPVLVRADGAGSTKNFLAHIRGLRQNAVQASFSLGWAVTEREREAITKIPARVWADAITTDGGHREHAALAEITALLPATVLGQYPDGMRVIVRREHPHPGAQLDAFEERDGFRYTAFATDTPTGQLAHLDARHRAHARVEDRIRCAKDTGLDHFPLPHLRDQRRLADRGDARRRPAHPHPEPSPPGRSRQGRTQDPALPTPARLRTDHPRRPPDPAPRPGLLALGERTRDRLRPTAGLTPADLTSRQHFSITRSTRQHRWPATPSSAGTGHIARPTVELDQARDPNRRE